jgi:hypothetical protein
MELVIEKVLNRIWQLAVEYLHWIDANDRYTPSSLLGITSAGLVFIVVIALAFSEFLSR